MKAREEQSRAVCELCSLVVGVIGSPPFHVRRLPSGLPTRTSMVTASGIASLLLGVSLTLMLCGSLTFMIGFFLMPWVLGLIAVLYTVGFVSSLSGFARLFFVPIPALTPKPGKELPGGQQISQV